MLRAMRWPLVLCFLWFACGDAKPGPAAVDADDTLTPADAADGVEGDTTTGPHDALPDTTPDTSPDATRPGTTDVSGLWVDDANGVPVGLLVRRGSDDATASRAIYDFVTVFDPVSGLFFELTMTDGQVRYPANTFFDGFSCETPIGIGVGPCTDCRSAWNLGFLHKGRWYKMRGGAAFETRGPGSVLKGGTATECVAHGTSNAKVFVVDALETNTPPTSFAAPLRFVAR